VRGHSRKPDELYTIVERLYAGPRVELFARYPRTDWTQWGDQLADHLPPNLPAGRPWECAPGVGALVNELVTTGTTKKGGGDVTDADSEC
jgi:hypothetical protein